MQKQLPEILEADADGTVAELYSDIRHITGLPRVNLIYRHFATIPNGLEWVWAQLRHHFQSQSMANAAPAVRELFEGHALAIIDSNAIARLPDVRNEVKNVFDFYLAANPMNLMALKVLQRACKEAGVGASLAMPTASRAAPVENPGDEIQRRISNIAILLTDGDPRIIPTVVRDLAEWPDYLQIFESTTRTVRAALDYSTRCDDISAHADMIAGEIGGALSTTWAIDDEALGEIASFCEFFPRLMIHTTLVLTTLRQLTPGTD